MKEIKKQHPQAKRTHRSSKKRQRTSLNSRHFKSFTKFSKQIFKTSIRKIKMVRSCSTNIDEGSIFQKDHQKNKKDSPISLIDLSSVIIRRPFQNSLSLSSQVENVQNLSEVKDYLQDIGSYLLNLDIKRSQQFGKGEHHVSTDHIRGGIKGIYHFGLLNKLQLQTQFLAFDLFHKMCRDVNLSLLHLQLKVAVSLFIAAKYHDSKTITIKHIQNYSLLKNVQHQNLMRSQTALLQLLNFNLSFPSPLQFIDLFNNCYVPSRAKRQEMINVCFMAALSEKLWCKETSLIAFTSLCMVQNVQNVEEWLQQEMSWRKQELKRLHLLEN